MVGITRRDMIMKTNLKINLKMMLMIYKIDQILLIDYLIMILKINLLVF